MNQGEVEFVAVPPQFSGGILKVDSILAEIILKIIPAVQEFVLKVYKVLEFQFLVTTALKGDRHGKNAEKDHKKRKLHDNYESYANYCGPKRRYSE